MSAADAGRDVDVGVRSGCSCFPPLIRRLRRSPETAGKRRKCGIRLPAWFSWPWAGGRRKKKRRGRRREGMVVLCTSFYAKNAALASAAVSRALCPNKVRSSGDTKKQSPTNPRCEVDIAPISTGPVRPEASCGAAQSTARLGEAQTEPNSPGQVTGTSSGCHLVPPDRSEPAGGLWTMATTLGVIVFFGRVSAVIFLCSCWYGTRLVRSRTAAVKRTGSSCSDRTAERVVDLCTEEYKKDVVMQGLLPRPSSRFL